MSRIGKKKIECQQVDCQINDDFIKGKSLLGEFSMKISPFVNVVIDKGCITTTPKILPAYKKYLVVSQWGTFSSILSGKIEGLKSQYRKVVRADGIGFKITYEPGENLVFNIGNIVPKVVLKEDIPSDVKINQINNVSIELLSCDKQSLGQFSSKLIGLYRYSAYRAKGITIEGRVELLKKYKKK